MASRVETNLTWLAVALAINAAFMLVEVAVGALAHSLALLSNAAHLLADPPPARSSRSTRPTSTSPRMPTLEFYELKHRAIDAFRQQTDRRRTPPARRRELTLHPCASGTF